MNILIAAICLFAGLIVGMAAGIFILAICTAAHDADAWQEGYGAGLDAKKPRP